MNKNLLFGSILILYLCLFHVQAQEEEINDCSTTSNYTFNSPFQTNLNRLLSSLLANGTLDGFYNDTIGTNPDTVYGLVSCRGDLPMEECRTCLSTLRNTSTQSCPNGREAILRYQNCLLRYSNRQFFSQADINRREIINQANVDDNFAAGYNQQLGGLMYNLSNDAMNRQTRFGYGMTNFTDFDQIYGMLQIYGMAQCTRDLSPTNCFGCLQSMYTSIPSCCNMSRGARIFSATCTIRYELYPFLTAPSTPPPFPPPSTNIVAIVVPIVGGGLLLLVVCAYLIIRRNAIKRKPDIIDDQDDIISEDSLQFNFNTIRIATDDFSDVNKLGEGGFGAVYKGELLDGQEIAVKRLSKNSGQGSQEFKNEVVLLHKLQHRNLVHLLGFCLAGEEKLLIYEYVPNRSLDKYIFDPIRKTELGWEMRYKIIGGIARGLLYLHEDSRLRIIHRDLKAGNVLLDEELIPKIADFGMAKLFGRGQIQGNTSRIAGTFGYMAPEYAMHGVFSVKTDVFSFGVLVLEIVSGQKTNSFPASGPWRNLLNYTWKLWREGDALKLMDPTLSKSYTGNEVMRCIHIGLLCVQENLDNRPTMSSVVQLLNNPSISLNQPSQPAFIFESTTGANDLTTDMESLLYSHDDEISLSYPR